ncbi:MAG: hypothetical protein ACUVRD_08345 [Bacteroidia bacterium]
MRVRGPNMDTVHLYITHNFPAVPSLGDYVRMKVGGMYLEVFRVLGYDGQKLILHRNDAGYNQFEESPQGFYLMGLSYVDTLYEGFYDWRSRKFRVCLPSMSGELSVSVTRGCITGFRRGWHIKGLRMRGYIRPISLRWTRDGVIEDNVIEYFNASGGGIDLTGDTNVVVMGNHLYGGARGIYVSRCADVLIRGNVLKRINMDHMSLAVDKNGGEVAPDGYMFSVEGRDGGWPAIQVWENPTSPAVISPSDIMVEYNHIDSCGNVGLSCRAYKAIVRYNVVDYPCSDRSDCGGIYGAVEKRSDPQWITYPDVLFYRNIVRHAYGSDEGYKKTDYAYLRSANALYRDINGKFRFVENVIYGCGEGIHIFDHDDTRLEGGLLYEGNIIYAKWNRNSYFPQMLLSHTRRPGVDGSQCGRPQALFLPDTFRRNIFFTLRPDAVMSLNVPNLYCDSDLRYLNLHTLHIGEENKYWGVYNPLTFRISGGATPPVGEKGASAPNFTLQSVQGDLQMESTSQLGFIRPYAPPVAVFNASDTSWSNLLFSNPRFSQVSGLNVSAVNYGGMGGWRVINGDTVVYFASDPTARRYPRVKLMDFILDTSKVLLVRFEARSFRGGIRRLYFVADASNVGNSGSWGMGGSWDWTAVVLDTVWRSYSFLYYPPVGLGNVALQNVRFYFTDLNQEVDTLWIDNLRIWQVRAWYVDEEERYPIFINDSSYRRRFVLPPYVYLDLDSNVVVGEVWVEPYYAKILIRTDQYSAPLSQREMGEVVLYPNPVGVGDCLQFRGLYVGGYEVEIYDGVGRLVERGRMEVGEGRYCMRGKHGSGLYVIRLVGKQVVSKPFVIRLD